MLLFVLVLLVDEDDGDSNVSIVVWSTKECNNDENDANDLSRFLIDQQISFFFSVRLVYLVLDRIFCWNYKLHASTGRIDNNSIFSIDEQNDIANRGRTSMARKKQDAVDKICICRLIFFLLPTSLLFSLSLSSCLFSLLARTRRQFVLRVSVGL